MKGRRPRVYDRTVRSLAISDNRRLIAYDLAQEILRAPDEDALAQAFANMRDFINVVMPHGVEPLGKRTDFCEPDCHCAKAGEVRCCKLLPAAKERFGFGVAPSHGELMIAVNHLWVELLKTQSAK